MLLSLLQPSAKLSALELPDHCPCLRPLSDPDRAGTPFTLIANVCPPSGMSPAVPVQGEAATLHI